MKRISFFSWSLMLVVLVSGLVLTGCSEDEEGFSLTKFDVVGFWEVYEATEDGETFDINSGYITINLKSDNNYRVKFFTNTYIGSYVIKGNKVVGTTLDPITEYFTFKSLNGNVATIDYSNSTGDKYIFKAKRTSSTSSEIPSDEPKEEVEFKLDYTFSESGDMTRATGEEVYTMFYNKYIKTKELTPKSYSLRFTRIKTNAYAEFNGYWDTDDGIRLPEGEYIVTGTSHPKNASVNVSDSVHLVFQDTVNITKDMKLLTLKAKYDSYLLLFDADNNNRVTFNPGENNYKSFELKKSSDNIFYLFMQAVYSSSTNIGIAHNSGKFSYIYLSKMPFEKGKYYYFNDMTNSFDIPMMESGN